MKKLIAGLLALSLLNSCSKENINQDDLSDGYVEYIIAAGDHSCNKSSIKKLNIATQYFTVLFDSSAIYNTIDPENQLDINKLYGFTEGTDPHYNSARIGWSFNNSKLRLYAYAYNDKLRMSEEITAVNIGEPIKCSIELENGYYEFAVNQQKIKLPRMLSTKRAEGYQLYPYFGGDEVAPHQVTIRIKNETAGR